MAKTKKVVQLMPTDIKEELLKKYPPKVARKRAQQIMINEATESEAPPEILANVRTIPGIITMRGCTYAGCKGVIMGPTPRHREHHPRPHRLRILLLAHPPQPDGCGHRR